MNEDIDRRVRLVAELLRITKLLRMWNAIRLAEEDPGLPISKIVERVRGGDESHFQRDFKKAFGVTFGEFRRCRSEESQ